MARYNFNDGTDDRARSRGVPVAEVIEEAKAISPMGDSALPGDVAAAVSFLSSDEARWITGTKLVVDGGLIGCDTYHLRKHILRLVLPDRKD